jgi:uncharacterized protein YfiM (DUF2279 family)
MACVLVTGDRHWECHDLARRVVARLVAKYGEVDIVQGAAAGVDYAFVEAAFEAGCGVASFPADWDVHGKAAGPRRNAEMVAAGADFAIAVHRNLRGSRGTKDCVRRCLAAGIPTWLIDSDDAEARPRRLEPGDV